MGATTNLPGDNRTRRSGSDEYEQAVRQRARDHHARVNERSAQAAADAELQKRRNTETVRIAKLANGYLVTETGTGDAYAFNELSEAFDHISDFYDKLNAQQKKA